MSEFICDQCGVSFIRKRSTVRGKHKFCSRACYGAWVTCTQKRQGQTRVSCTYCGRQFWKWNYRIKPGKHDFCSKLCASKWQQKQAPPGHICRVCEVCGKEFSAYRWHVENRGHGRFCSYKCLANSNAARMKEEGNPNWKGGIIIEPYAYERFSYWRNRALKRDKRTCQIGGETEEDGVRLVVHHIIPVHEFAPDYQAAHRLWNLITLCRSCHGKVESGSRALPDGWLERAQRLIVEGMESCYD